MPGQPQIITREGKPPMKTCGELPKVGSKAPGFVLTNIGMENVNLDSFKGKYVIVNIFPSTNTPTCEKSVLKFESEAATLKNTVVLNVSMDLPFAHKNFCADKKFTKDNVISLSAMPRPGLNPFGEDYGVTIMDGYLRGAFARAVVVIDPEGLVLHTELVRELTKQPNYETCLSFIPKLDNSNTNTASTQLEVKDKKEVTGDLAGGNNKPSEANTNAAIQITTAFDLLNANASNKKPDVAKVEVGSSLAAKPSQSN